MMSRDASGLLFDPAQPEIQRIQKRTLIIIGISSVAGRAAMTVGFVVASLLLKEILDGDARLAGLSSAAITVGSAFSAGWLSSYMSKKGRRPGLVLGYLLAAAGSLLAGFGGHFLALVPYLAGLVLFGVGQGATNLSRWVAADLAVPLKKAKAIGIVVFVSTVGAVGGPSLAGPGSRLGESFSLHTYAGPLMVSAFFFLLAALLLQIFLRPDPLVLSGSIGGGVDTRESAGFRLGCSTILASTKAKFAVLGLVTSQAVMVMLMTMTPLHMIDHGFETDDVGLVLSTHTAGMFAFAALAGWMADHLGRINTIIVGSVVLVTSALLTALAPQASLPLMYSGLFLLGLGWSFVMVASSALLDDTVEQYKVAAQGVADMLTSLISGLGAIVSGLIFAYAGFVVLSVVGAVASMVMMALVLLARNIKA